MWDGADPLDAPGDWATVVRPAVGDPAPTSRDTRSGGGAGGVRRLTPTRRDTRPERRRRPTPLLMGAAAAVLLLLAVGAVRLAQSGRGGPAAAFDGGNSAAAGASGPAAAPTAQVGSHAVIVRSGTDYTSATLAQGARRLLAKATTRRAQRGARAAPPRPGSHPSPRGPRRSRRGNRGPRRGSRPARHRRDQPGAARGLPDRPRTASDAVVAVDLARYRGREAAVLIVRTESGYEVWVVERTCQAGDEGTLAETTLPG